MYKNTNVLWFTWPQVNIYCPKIQMYYDLHGQNEYILSQDTNVLWFMWPKMNIYCYILPREKNVIYHIKKKHILWLTHFWLPSQYNIVGGSNISRLTMRPKSINHHCILLSSLHNGLRLVIYLSVCNNSQPLLKVPNRQNLLESHL